MAKYAMLNCWDDLNKGDLGIMLATVQEFKRADPGSKFVCVSCFNRTDPSFEEGHVILRRFVPEIYPAIFGTLGLHIFGKYRKDVISKLIGLLVETVKYFFCMHLPRNLARHILGRDERKTLDVLIGADVVFSKGGSVFTDYNSRRGSIALIRLCRFYTLLDRFGIKYYILGQSFGPVSGKAGIKATNRVIDNAERVYVRERECVKKYPELHLGQIDVGYSNDVGFLIEPHPVKPDPIEHSHMNVGMTIRGEKNDETYLSAMEQMIRFLVNEKKVNVHIFQQVSMDTEPDNVAATHILNRMDRDTMKNIVYHKKNYIPQELCWLYGEMDYFIGTRLHSTIFAMRAGTPSLGIVYHGTKTQGIFGNIGVPELVISGDVSFNILQSKFEYMVANKDRLRSTIIQGVDNARRDMRSAIYEIIHKAKGEK